METEINKTEVVLTKVPIHNRLLTEPRKSKRLRNKIQTYDLEFLNTDSSQSDENIIHLKEPEEKITLIERAIGYFNAEKDEEAQKNQLNVSISGGPPFICKICNNWFYMGSKLKLHYILNHQIFHCEICSNLFSTSEEKQRHLSKFHSPLFCEICQKHYENSLDLFTHYQTEHDSTTCQFCGILLQPQNMANSHIIRKHCVYPKYLEIYNKNIVENVPNNISEFFCALCNKNREMEIFFGHMNSHHKLSVSSLMNLMVKLDTNVSVTGARKDDVEGERDDEKVYKNSCPVCLIRFTKKIPQEFHFIYCQGKVQCKYCEKHFSSANYLDKHFTRAHSKFLCRQGCEKLAYNSEENLTKHYIKFHESVMCRYCNNFVGILNNSYEEHLEKNHKYKAVIMKNFTDSLFEVTQKQNKHIVVCCLCDENITLLAEKIRDIFQHYNLIHSVSLLRILQLISPKPMLEEYEDFYREINESIKKENENIPQENVNKTDESVEQPIYLHQIPKLKIKIEPMEVINDQEPTEEASEDDEEAEEDETPKNKKFEDFSHLQTEIESDFDVDEAEILINSDSEFEDENSDFVCEFCNEKTQKLTELIKHTQEKHKLRTKYRKYDCKYCSELIISYKTHANHLLSHHGNADFDFSKEMFNCDCHNYQVVHSLARSHILKVHSENITKYSVEELGLKCRFCDEKFWERVELNEHEIDVHFKDNQMEFQKCCQCSKVFSSQKCLSTHTTSHHSNTPQFTNLIYKCLNCTLSFPTLTLLRDHFQIDHPNSKIYRCPVPQCSKVCKREKYILRHLKTPHQIKTEQGDMCDICGKRFKSIRAATIHKLMKHQRDRAGFQCRICNERFATSEQRKLHHTTAHPGQLAYNCLECGKGFISKSGLYGHRKIHQQNSSLVCPYCSKEFSRRDSYNEHLLIHIGPRHQCPHCPKSFTQRSNLTRHVRIHTGAKPYQCCYCDKRFSDRGACSSHERVHTKEEHCECSYCGKRFTKKQKLRYHIKFHTGEGLLDCEICGKQFSNSYTLKEHRKIHNTETLVMCKCGRGFSSQKYLQRHVHNVHNNNGQTTKYVCPICFKALYHKSSYNNHVMTHSAVKHVRCLLCNKEYNTRKTVKRHIQEQHHITKAEEVYKHIYVLSPQEAGLNVPAASEMAIKVKVLDDPKLLSIEVAKLREFVAATGSASASVMSLPVTDGSSGAQIQIKAEPISEDSEDNNDDTDEDSEDEMSLATRVQLNKGKKIKNKSNKRY